MLHNNKSLRTSDALDKPLKTNGPSQVPRLRTRTWTCDVCCVVLKLKFNRCLDATATLSVVNETSATCTLHMHRERKREKERDGLCTCRECSSLFQVEQKRRRL